MRRVWADGREFDLTNFEMRVHNGGINQPPDPLIEAQAGRGQHAGLSRPGLCRVRAPAAGRLWQSHPAAPVRGAAAGRQTSRNHPGGGDYSGLDRIRAFDKAGDQAREAGRKPSENRHTLLADTDLAASLDELQMLCPNLEHLALVVSWFGDDLRAGHCRIEPGVTRHDWRLLEPLAGFRHRTRRMPRSYRTMAAARPMVARRPTDPSSRRSPRSRRAA